MQQKNQLNKNDMNIASKMSDLADQFIKDKNNLSTKINYIEVHKVYNKCLNFIEEFARKGNYCIRIEFTNKSFFSWLYYSSRYDRKIYSTKYRTIVEVEKLLRNDGFEASIYRCTLGDDVYILKISW